MDNVNTYKVNEEAVKKIAERVYDNGSTVINRNDLEEMFPELKESEDERIRGKIIATIHLYYGEPLEDEAKEMIAWLEKQGEQKTTIEMKTPEESLGIDSDTYNKVVDECIYGEQKLVEFKPSFRVGDVIKPKDPVLGEPRIVKGIHPKFGYDTNNGILDFEFEDNWELVEQKPADKVEPKFKVGDWVVWDNKISCHIDNIYQGKESLMYTITDAHDMNRSYSIKGFDNNAHLWTIQYAKDGDVLCCENGWTCIFKTLVNDETFSSYCFMDKTKTFWETGSECHTLEDEFVKAYNGEIHPATKEQRDTLMKAMTDAGYTFDFENKELKKNEQKTVDADLKDIVDKEANAIWKEINTGGSHSIIDSFNQFYGICMQVAEAVVDCKKPTEWIQELESKLSNATPEQLAEWKEKYFKVEPAWSEEDKKMSRFIGNAITADGASEYLESKGIQVIDAHVWLDELKDRVLPQPKPAWSEEDEKILNSLISILARISASTRTDRTSVNYTFSKEIDWLKSIRPQNTWKPSEEQMNALGFAVDCVVPDEFCYKRTALKSLLTDLRNLTE